MRDLTPEFSNEINKRGGIIAHTFIMITARNRDNNNPETLCLWTGDDNQDFTIEGVSNTFYGAGTVISCDDLTQEIGTMVRKFSMTLSHLTTEALTLMRVYDTHRAPVRVYTVLFSTDSGLPITTAIRRFKGWIDKNPIRTGVKGGAGSAKFECVSASRNLTRIIPSRRSNENQKLRNVNDAFFSHVGMSGVVETPWGSKTVSGNGKTGNFFKDAVKMVSVR